MKKLLIVLFVLSFGAISFAQVGQAEDLTADSSSIDVATDIEDQLIDDAVVAPIDDSVVEPIDDSVEEPIDEPIENPIEAPIDEPIEEPIENPIEEPITITVYVDIKPGSCPNPLNVKSKGVLPVAILGSEDLDVTDIDPASIRLGGVVAPLRSSIEDVSHPWNVEDCEDYGVDGYDDLTLKFDNQQIVAALVAAFDEDIEDGDVFELNLTGTLADDTQIEGADTVLILKKGKK